MLADSPSGAGVVAEEPWHLCTEHLSAAKLRLPIRGSCHVTARALKSANISFASTVCPRSILDQRPEVVESLADISGSKSDRAEVHVSQHHHDVITIDYDATTNFHVCSRLSRFSAENKRWKTDSQVPRRRLRMSKLPEEIFNLSNPTIAWETSRQDRRKRAE
jgi:hypothetical protein